MHVFVTGATGFIGSVVTEKLAAHGHTISALARSAQSIALLHSRGIKPIQGSLEESAVLIQAARGAEAVMHLGFGRGPEAIGTDKQCVEAFLVGLAGSDKPFLYTSGTMVTGDSGDRVTDETAPLDTKGSAVWRGEHEQIMLAAVEQGVHSIVIRPASLVYGRGAGGSILGLLQSARREGAVRYIGTGENRKSPVHVDDLASLYIAALEQAPSGEVFIGASQEVVGMKVVAEAASLAAGTEGKTLSWPYEEARKALGFLADIQAMNSVVSNAKARRMLKWNPTGPLLMDELNHGSYRT